MAEAPAQGSSSPQAAAGATLSPPPAGADADRTPADEPAEDAEPDRKAWVRDGRDIVVRGRPMLDVMRDWHGAEWPLVEEAILATLNHEDSHNLDLPLERDSLGDIDACFEVAPDQALKWFEGSLMPRMVKSFAGTTSSVELPGPVILRAAVKNPASALRASVSTANTSPGRCSSPGSTKSARHSLCSPRRCSMRSDPRSARRSDRPAGSGGLPLESSTSRHFSCLTRRA